jgi:SAM-dependent methyltransferase
MNSQDWFSSWFDSPYYHQLYSHRDETEARDFIQNLVRLLKLDTDKRVLDLACGKGRHAIALHENKLDVTGIDLSPTSIQEAKKGERKGLEFFEHDMRRPFHINYFDAVFNLFTSFGYFETQHDNEQVVDAVAKSLHSGGFFIIDFFNSAWVEKEMSLHNSGEKELGPILFSWNKKIEAGHIYKNITVNDAGEKYHFTERVQLLKPEDFEKLLNPRFEILNVYGDYQLNTFVAEKSKRLIIIARKR